MNSVNHATVILFLESMNSYAEAALHLPSNKHYLVEPIVVEDAPRVSPTSREGTPFIAPSNPTCAIHLSQKPYDPLDGWVFGSDEERCDFQLSDSKRAGVSARHFRIHFNWTSRRLLLTNLSQHHTMMSSPKLGRDVIVRDSRVLPLDEAIAVTAGAVCLSVHIPDRGEHQRKFDGALDAYHEEVQQAIPRIAGLCFGYGGVQTPLVVLGKRNRVQYIIDNEGDVGSGAFGIISKALDPVTGNLYAAKRFTKISARARIVLAEIDIHRKISHEHVVSVIDVQEDLPLLIMEYIPLGNLLQQERFSFPETMTMFSQQLQAVRYLHGMGITHRDIKPENILIESRNPTLNTKLSDFGLSSDRSQLQTFCGTQLYVAPEVCSQGKQYTNAVDIWSLGVVGLQLAYSLPKQRRKWDAREWTEAVYRHARDQRGRFAALLQKCLLLAPSARPSAERCLVDMSCWPEVKRPESIQTSKAKGTRETACKPPVLFGAISTKDDVKTKARTELLSTLRDNMLKRNRRTSRVTQEAEKGKSPTMTTTNSDDIYEDDEEEETEEEGEEEEEEEEIEEQKEDEENKPLPPETHNHHDTKTTDLSSTAGAAARPPFPENLSIPAAPCHARAKSETAWAEAIRVNH